MGSDVTSFFSSPSNLIGLAAAPFTGGASLIMPAMGLASNLLGPSPTAQPESMMDYQQQLNQGNMYQQQQLNQQNAAYQAELQKQMMDYAYGKQTDWQNQQANLWKQNAFPTTAEINAQAYGNTAALGDLRTQAYQNMAKNLSTRGIGAGSPFSGGPASAIEGSYMKGLSDLKKSVVEYANKPRFNFPFVGNPAQAGVTVQGVSSSGSSYAPNYGSNSNPLGMAMGMQAGSNAFSDILNGTNNTWNNLWAPNNPYTLDQYAYEASPYSDMVSVPGLDTMSAFFG